MLMGIPIRQVQINVGLNFKKRENGEGEEAHVHSTDTCGGIGFHHILQTVSSPEARKVR